MWMLLFREVASMKKMLVYILGLIVLIVILMPFITGNLEKEVLNDQTRANIGGEFMELSDGVTHYELKGDEGRKTIVLVHGNAAPYFSWDNNFDYLVDAGFRVLRYDVFGHGFSDRPEMDKYNRDLYDRQLVELLDKLGIDEPIYIAGTSQGGSISIYFTATHPGKVEKVALLSPLFDSFEGKGMANLLRTKGVGEYFMGVVGDKTAVNPSNVLYSSEKNQELKEKLSRQIHYKGKKRAILANMRGDAVNDATDFYKQVKDQGIPMLLTWGKNDKSISGESMDRLRNIIPKIQYHELEEASHLAHYEFSEEINPILIKFFKE
jgi:pimeloyl-ACP methyl ester carboxylesterase